MGVGDKQKRPQGPFWGFFHLKEDTNVTSDLEQLLKRIAFKFHLR
jgi:hypothetical protein